MSVCLSVLPSQEESAGKWCIRSCGTRAGRLSCSWLHPPRWCRTVPPGPPLSSLPALPSKCTLQNSFHSHLWKGKSLNVKHFPISWRMFTFYRSSDQRRVSLIYGNSQGALSTVFYRTIRWVLLVHTECITHIQYRNIIYESGDFAPAKSPLSPNPMLKEGLAHHKEWISDHQFKDLLSLVWSIEYIQCELLLKTGFIFCTLEAPPCFHKAN